MEFLGEIKKFMIKYILVEGTFSSFKLKQESVDMIQRYQNGENNLKEKIVKPVQPENLHVSMIYSPDKNVDDSYINYAEKRDENGDIIVMKETFSLNYRHYGGAMVLLFKSKELENEFRKIYNVNGDVFDMKAWNRRHDIDKESIFGLSVNDYKYASFKPHLSLSYNSLKNSHLRKAGLLPPDYDIILDKEYIEEYKDAPNYTKEDIPANSTSNIATHTKPMFKTPLKRKRLTLAFGDDFWKKYISKKMNNSKYIVEEINKFNFDGSIALMNDDTGEHMFYRYGLLNSLEAGVI